MERGSVTRIVDGDTFHALLDGVDETVRIFGIDTPERGEACFSEATNALRVLVATHGGQVLLVSDVRKRDRYDRLLRYVYTSDGLSINAVLIARGFAHAWTDDGQLRDPLVALEAEARAEQRGCLWG
jgi:micrococcal nuclease